MSPIDIETIPGIPDDLQEILSQSVMDSRLFGRFFFEEHFGVYTSLHKQIDEAIKKMDMGLSKPRLLIAAPRGLGKTTTVLFKNLARRILFRMSRYIVYVSNTATNAELQTENLKYGLRSSEQVRDLFPPINLAEGDKIASQFSKTAWTANGYTMVLPRGAGQQIRGLLFHGNRPDFLVFDDLENKEAVQSEEQRQKLKEWFFADAMKCISRFDKSAKMLYIDTLKHEDALMRHLIESGEWEYLELEACDDEFNPTAEEYMTKEELIAEYERHVALGIPDVFYQEYRNKPTGKGAQSFNSENFRYYTQLDNTITALSQDYGRLRKTNPQEADNIPEDDRYREIELISDLQGCVIIDPAKTLNPTAADSAIVGISISTQTGLCYIREIVAERIMPDEVYQIGFEMCDRIGARILAVEVTSLNNFITQPLTMEAQRRGFLGEIMELKATGKKEARISTLIPLYNRHQIIHPLRGAEKLEGQLLSFPRSRLWDIMDALAYLPKLLKEREIFFSTADPIYHTQTTYNNPVNPTRQISGLELTYANDYHHEGFRNAQSAAARERYDTFVSQLRGLSGRN